ncbi:hypothetical protein BAE44_0000480 [Dichanthelium oligosanthes]|uniref:RRM domain-containing protein n=1 Tax=Dichanthelium oligosanthes TaxID=888268 RepID=A0A1E5WMY1_9POAL|nr:hypothetical protein BAE44_0000480 [Dichanthelium oligosanthes]
MSLHIGRLSQDVRQSYLEHLFQRFGHCTVNLKDGYGFAVYDSDDDATRALRALHGKFVCGERITVNWSKQQPRVYQGFRRSSRFVEPFHGRNFRDARNNIMFRDSVARKNHPANHDQGHNPDAVPEKESDKFAEVVNDAGESIGDDLEEVKRDEGGAIDEDPGELKTDEGGTIDANAIEHDRWAETGKVSTSPQHKSAPDVENKNLDGPKNSPLKDNLGFMARSEVKNMDDNKQEGKGSALNSKVLNGEVLVPDKDANAAGYTGVYFDKKLVDDNAANGVQSLNANFEDSSSVKSKQDILARNGRNKSLKLTTNEVITALKRYGMEAQEDSSDQPVEKYFGAARLWPWEIIYYRRRKKGPISTENYAKRLEQNKEFGIVDQYVRSSSGWWECH